MPAKWRVLEMRTAHGSRTYPIDVFLIGTTVLNETYDGTNIVVAGSKTEILVIAYDRKLADGTILTFLPAAAELPIIFEDNEGTKWDVFWQSHCRSTSRRTVKVTYFSCSLLVCLVSL